MPRCRPYAISPSQPPGSWALPEPTGQEASLGCSSLKQPRARGHHGQPSLCPGGRPGACAQTPSSADSWGLWQGRAFLGVRDSKSHRGPALGTGAAGSGHSAFWKITDGWTFRDQEAGRLGAAVASPPGGLPSGSCPPCDCRPARHLQAGLPPPPADTSRHLPPSGPILPRALPTGPQGPRVKQMPLGLLLGVGTQLQAEPQAPRAGAQSPRAGHCVQHVRFAATVEVSTSSQFFTLHSRSYLSRI